MADGDNYSIRRAANLANRLRSALLEEQNSGFNQLADHGGGEWRPLPDPIHLEQMTKLRSFGEIVDTLDQLLDEAGYGTKPSKCRLPPDEFWTLGSMTFTFPIRTIHGGFVEPVRRVPIIPRVPETVVAYSPKDLG